MSMCADPHLASWKVVGSPSWYTPSSLPDLFSIITSNPESSVRLVAGDTGRGVAAINEATLFHVPA